MSSEEKVSYKHTLNLPTTSFSIRANAAEKESLYRTQWAQGIEEQSFTPQHPDFVLHDGPPYANGDLHLGHALNKVLKDIMVRVARLSGKTVSYAPGWDCHGLPIEIKVAAEHGSELRTTDPVAFKKLCRAYAKKWCETQEKQFKEFGVWAEWNRRYITMDPTYEADILRSLATFIEKGHIERKGKTVPWCFHCETVLANAEIEYADRKDPSCYILFQAVGKKHNNLSLSFLIWTTTPWTIPLNRAVVLHPNAQYAVVQLDDERAAIVGADLVGKLRGVLDRELPVLTTIHSSELVGLQAQHPLVSDLQVPIISDDGVSTSDGTACLHSAPGCGPEDYLMGIKNGLEIYSPLGPDGRYTDGIDPAELNGEKITDGQWWVLKQLKKSGALLHKASLKHSFPHCWRCRNGLMFRATDQWFCNLNKNNLVTRAQKSLENIRFVPLWGQSRLHSFLENRTEWCISRQRSWGVPIPALFDTTTDTAYTSAHFVRAIADRVAQSGIEYWDTVTIAQLRADDLLPAALIELSDEQITKETDILDVWFDSGVSHAAVIGARDGVLPVDMYLEGSDQHRGWFQSSLLSSMVLHDAAPMQTILTHGFVVDAKGHKMSKSLGNAVDPQKVVKKYGADVLRLWVASVDYERDMPISPQMLDQVAESYRKIRNTCRFLLSNLYDFTPADAVAYDQLPLLDRYAIEHVNQLNEQVQKLYASYSFAQVVQALTRYCTVDLSAHYLDISKDCLYVEGAKSPARRSAQTAQYHIIETLLRLMAPLLVYTAEDVYANLPYERTADSVHLTTFVAPRTSDATLADLFAELAPVRETILRAIESQRATGAIKHSLEAALAVMFPKNLLGRLEKALRDMTLDAFVKQWCIVSRATVTVGDQLNAQAQPAGGVKCPRCWHWTSSEHADGLCGRCESVVS